MNAAMLTSERLILRPWRDEDLDPLFAINGDPESMRYFAATMTRVESDAWAARLRAHFAEHGWGKWVVAEAATGAFVGVVGLMTIPWQADFTPAVEIGWRIGARFPANSPTVVLPDPQEEQAAPAALVSWLPLRLALSMSP